MNIIIPIGGAGERFSEENFTLPKPLIPVLGKPMIHRLISSLSITSSDTVRIIYNATLKRYNFEDLIRFWFPNLNISFVSLPKQTKGPSETLQYGLSDLTGECLLLDCDAFYDEDILELYRNTTNKNCIFYFNSTDPNPIYSYILIANGHVIDIVEKTKISDNANVGAYGFASVENLLKLCVSHTPTYISALYHTMIRNDENIIAQEISKFHCVGTPIQLKSYCNRFIHTADPLRVCFDLDNTLVTYPDVIGDYSSVRPITRNIEFLKLLHRLGHHIIIYTARRMRTHKGNVGAIVADIGEVTIETLKRFSIPYDELYFGKPYANFYIDDLAVNPYVSLHESTGLYNTTTKSRIFNDVNFTETKVTKISNNSGESYYYNNIPERVKHLFPVIHSIEDNTITMENIDGVSYSHLLINEQLKENDIDLLITTIHKLHEIKSSTNFSDMYFVYASKLKARYVEHQELYNDLKLNDTFNNLLNYLTTYENNNEGINCVIHGDPVFTNVIKTESGIKFIDMRGKTTKNTIYGDLHYDYAKIHQSLMGYDFILNNIEINDGYLKTLREVFYTHCNVKDINLLTASLYFTLLPLHEYDKDKFDRYKNIIQDLI
tara:strand:- start:1187 stop:3004 length:1818 start_codon:yes stop_codon:yes gene_type:complete